MAANPVNIGRPPRSGARPAYDPTDPSTWAPGPVGGDAPADPATGGDAASQFLSAGTSDVGGDGVSVSPADASSPQLPGPMVPPGAPANTYQGGFTNTQSPGQMLEQNRMNIFGRGEGIQNSTGQAQQYYSQLGEGYRQAANTAYGNLAQTPGYNAGEASQIGADYSKFNTDPNQLANRFLSSDEQSAITGNPNAGMQYYNPDTVRNIAGQAAGNMDNLAAQENQWLSGNIDRQALQQSGDAAKQIGGFLNSSKGDVNSALSGAKSGVADAVGQARSGVSGAVGQATSGANAALGGASRGIGEALGTESGSLDAAVKNPNLLLDPSFQGKYQMSDADVRGYESQADRAIGNKYQTEIDTLARDAAAQGNTSPIALAAQRAQLLRQEGVQSADAMTDARLAAKNTQAQRLQTGESMRLGAQQTSSGMQAQAAEALGQQGVGAQEFLGATGTNAALAEGQMSEQGALATGQMANQGALATGQMGVGAGLALGQQGISATMGQEGQRLGAQQFLTGTLENAADTAANRYAQAIQYGTGAQMGAEQYAQGTGEQLAQYGDAASSQRAGMIAGNRQNTLAGNQNTQYQQGVNSQQLNSQGQQTLGNARMSGQQQYRNFLTGEQGAGQSGAQTAMGQGIQAYGLQTSGINTAAASQVTNNNSLSPGQQMGTQLGNTVLSGFFADGGIATKPTSAILGENGPEAVVPLGNADMSGGNGANAQPFGGTTAMMPRQPLSPYGSQVPQRNSPAMALMTGQNPFSSTPIGQMIQARQQQGQQRQQSRMLDQAATGMQQPADQPRPPSVPNNGAPQPGPAYGQQDMERLPKDPDATSFMAGGGIVTSPTKAILGEKGPEAVIPLRPGPNAKFRPTPPMLKSMYHNPGLPPIPRMPSVRPPSGMR